MPRKPIRKIARGSAKRTVAELIVERMKLSELKPHPRNPRNHPKPGSPEWEVLKKSLEHDYFDPMVWNKRNSKLVSGHLRRKVFMEMGVKEADVVVVDYDEPTHLARMIAANKLIGEDNPDLLAGVLHELGEIEDFDFSLTGFTLAEVAEMQDADEADPEKATEYSLEEIDRIASYFGAGAKPTVDTASKQLWRVGEHYLYIGSVLQDHAAYTPLLTALAKEFPERKVLLVPMPDPLMLGCVDKKVAAVFVQPAPLAAALALSLLKKKNPKHKITLLSHETKKLKKAS